MKKLLFILAILFAVGISNKVEAQNSFGVATELQSKVPGDPWPGWSESSGPILIYIDLGFGFIAVENDWKDRFILNSLDKVNAGPGKEAYVMKCVDKDKKECTITVVLFESGNTSIEIAYNDIEYAYLIYKGVEAVGYPQNYFENKKEMENSGAKGVQL